MNIKKLAAVLAALSVIISDMFCVTAAAASPEDDFVVSGSVITGYTGKGGDIVIPDSITEIDTFAFYKCTALKSVTFEGDMYRVGSLSFLGCSNLERVTFKGSVFGDVGSDDFDSGLGWNAFMGCKNLKTVEFVPNSRLDIIRRAAFMDCASLSEVKLPGDVGKICECAFSNCPELTRLEIPSMTELEPLAAGYMYDEITEEHVKADGIAAVQAVLDFGDDVTAFEEVRQKPITLIVVPNSSAETYAKENGIAYEYKNASDTTEGGSTKSPETGGAGMQTLLAAMVLSLTVMIFTGVKRT